MLPVKVEEWAGSLVSLGVAKLSDLVRTDQDVLWRAVSWSVRKEQFGSDLAF